MTKRFTEVTEFINSIESKPKLEAKRLLRNFDVSDAELYKDVKHYIIQSEGPDEEEFVTTQLQYMEDAIWYTVIDKLKTAYLHFTDNNEELFKILTSDVKIGKILVAQPLRFSHVGVPLNELKSSAFTMEQPENKVVVEAEINFTIELYK